MRFTVTSENLQNKISFLGRGVSSKSQLPVLLNILMETKDGYIILNSTDLEIGIQTKIPANVEEEGSITTPAKTFIDFINTLGSENISFQSKEGGLELKTKKTKSSFQTTPPDDFPKLYTEKGSLLFQSKKSNLTESFNKTVFAASTDFSRPALSGIYIKQEKSEGKTSLLIVATDGYRLSLKQSFSLGLETAKTSLLDKPILIPVRILKELLSLKESKEDVFFYISEEKNQVLIEQGETIILGRLINAPFPTYEKIIPQSSTTKTVFNREEMLRAVKTAAIFARDAANIVKLSITDDKIMVSANAPQVGENSVEIEAKKTGEDNEIAFNVRYLLELLQTLEDEDIIFEMTTPTSPGVFKIKGDDSFLHLIMPIRVQSEE